MTRQRQERDSKGKFLKAPGRPEVRDIAGTVQAEDATRGDPFPRDYYATRETPPRCTIGLQRDFKGDTPDTPLSEARFIRRRGNVRTAHVTPETRHIIPSLRTKDRLPESFDTSHEGEDLLPAVDNLWEDMIEGFNRDCEGDVG
jgi:hypothetical protein